MESERDETLREIISVGIVKEEEKLARQRQKGEKCRPMILLRVALK